MGIQFKISFDNVRKAVDKMNKTVADAIKKQEELGEGFGNTGVAISNMTKAYQKLEKEKAKIESRMKKEIIVRRNNTQSLRNAAKALSESVSKNEKQSVLIEKQNRDYNKLAESLKKINSQYKKMSSDLSKIQSKLAKISRTGGGGKTYWGRQTESLVRFNRQLRQLLPFLTTTYLAWKGKEMFGNIIGQGGDFRQELVKVTAIIGTTLKQSQALETEIRKLGKTTEWTTLQITDAAKFLGMTGLTAEQTTGALQSVLNLATAGQIDLARAADITTNAMVAMGLQVKDLSKVNDTFIATTTMSNVSIEQMADTFRYAAPKANAYGYSISELSALTGALGNAGIQGSLAGTQLSFAIGKASKVMKELGGDTSLHLLDVLDLISKKGWSTSKIIKKFAERGSRAAIMLKNITPLVRLFQKQIEDSVGISNKLAKKMRDTYVNDVKVMKSAFSELGISIFDNWNNSLRNAAQSMTDFISNNKQGIVEFFSSLGEGVKNATDTLDHFGFALKLIGDTFLVLSKTFEDHPILMTLFTGGALASFITKSPTLGAITGIGAALLATATVVKERVNLKTKEKVLASILGYDISDSNFQQELIDLNISQTIAFRKELLRRTTENKGDPLLDINMSSSDPSNFNNAAVQQYSSNITQWSQELHNGSITEENFKKLIKGIITEQQALSDSVNEAYQKAQASNKAVKKMDAELGKQMAVLAQIGDTEARINDFLQSINVQKTPGLRDFLLSLGISIDDKEMNKIGKDFKKYQSFLGELKQDSENANKAYDELAKMRDKISEQIAYKDYLKNPSSLNDLSKQRQKDFTTPNYIKDVLNTNANKDQLTVTLIQTKKQIAKKEDLLKEVQTDQDNLTTNFKNYLKGRAKDFEAIRDLKQKTKAVEEQVYIDMNTKGYLGADWVDKSKEKNAAYTKKKGMNAVDSNRYQYEQDLKDIQKAAISQLNYLKTIAKTRKLTEKEVRRYQVEINKLKTGRDSLISLYKATPDKIKQANEKIDTAWDLKPPEKKATLDDLTSLFSSYYQDISGMADTYWEQEEKLIDQNYTKNLKILNDLGVANAKQYAKAIEQEEKYQKLKEIALSTGGMQEGISYFFSDMEKGLHSTAQFWYDTMKDINDQLASGFSEVMFNVIEGKANDLSSIFGKIGDNFLKKLTDKMADVFVKTNIMEPLASIFPSLSGAMDIFNSPELKESKIHTTLLQEIAKNTGGINNNTSSDTNTGMSSMFDTLTTAVMAYGAFKSGNTAGGLGIASNWLSKHSGMFGQYQGNVQTGLAVGGTALSAYGLYNSIQNKDTMGAMTSSIGLMKNAYNLYSMYMASLNPALAANAYGVDAVTGADTGASSGTGLVSDIAPYLAWVGALGSVYTTITNWDDLNAGGKIASFAASAVSLYGAIATIDTELTALGPVGWITAGVLSIGAALFGHKTEKPRIWADDTTFTKDTTDKSNLYNTSIPNYLVHDWSSMDSETGKEKYRKMVDNALNPFRQFYSLLINSSVEGYADAANKIFENLPALLTTNTKFKGDSGVFDNNPGNDPATFLKDNLDSIFWNNAGTQIAETVTGTLDSWKSSPSSTYNFLGRSSSLSSSLAIPNDTSSLNSTDRYGDTSSSTGRFDNGGANSPTASTLSSDIAVALNDSGLLNIIDSINDNTGDLQTYLRDNFSIVDLANLLNTVTLSQVSFDSLSNYVKSIVFGQAEISSKTLDTLISGWDSFSNDFDVNAGYSQINTDIINSINSSMGVTTDSNGIQSSDILNNAGIDLVNGQLETLTPDLLKSVDGLKKYRDSIQSVSEIITKATTSIENFNKTVDSLTGKDLSSLSDTFINFRKQLETDIQAMIDANASNSTIQNAQNNINDNVNLGVGSNMFGITDSSIASDIYNKMNIPTGSDLQSLSEQKAMQTYSDEQASALFDQYFSSSLTNMGSDISAAIENGSYSRDVLLQIIAKYMKSINWEGYNQDISNIVSKGNEISLKKITETMDKLNSYFSKWGQDSSLLQSAKNSTHSAISNFTELYPFAEQNGKYQDLLKSSLREAISPLLNSLSSSLSTMLDFGLTDYQSKINDINKNADDIHNVINYYLDTFANNQDISEALDNILNQANSFVNKYKAFKTLSVMKDTYSNIGNIKANILGKNDQYSLMQMQNKYNVDLSTTGKQSSWLDEFLSKSTPELIQYSNETGISISEIGKDMTTLGKIVNDVSNTFSSLIESIDSYMNSLIFSKDNYLNPELKKNLAKQNFETLYQQSLSSDTDASQKALQALPDAAKTFMNYAKSTDVSMLAYNTDMSYILSSLSNAEDYAKTYVKETQDTGLTINDQTNILQNSADEISALKDQMKDIVTSSDFDSFVDGLNYWLNTDDSFTTVRKSVDDVNGSIKDVNETIQAWISYFDLETPFNAMITELNSINDPNGIIAKGLTDIFNSFDGSGNALGDIKDAINLVADYEQDVKDITQAQTLIQSWGTAQPEVDRVTNWASSASSSDKTNMANYLGISQDAEDKIIQFYEGIQSGQWTSMEQDPFLSLTTSLNNLVGALNSLIPELNLTGSSSGTTNSGVADSTINSGSNSGVADSTINSGSNSSPLTEETSTGTYFYSGAAQNLIEQWGGKTQDNIDRIQGWATNASTSDLQDMASYLGISTNDETDVLKYYGVPGYAKGGYHEGGLAFVGENGVELINSPPSTISSNNDTQLLLSNANQDIVQEIQELRKDNKAMRSELTSANIQLIKLSTKMNNRQEKWDSEGLPATVSA